MTVSINSTAIIFNNDSTSQNSAGITTITNLGSGNTVYYSKSGSNAECRILFETTTGSITQNANVITFTI
jgi:hypothetical protein